MKIRKVEVHVYEFEVREEWFEKLSDEQKEDAANELIGDRGVTPTIIDVTFDIFKD